MKVLDLYCGLGGWAKGLIELGFNVTGYDIVDYSEQYPGEFYQADLLNYCAFPMADVVVASPPCTDFSKSSLPSTWKSVQKSPPDIPLALKLFERCFEIISVVKPKYWIIENVRGAQPYVGRAVKHIGSRYFWGWFPDFDVSSKEDVYGKWLLPPSPDRPALRSVIPYSISVAFGNAIKKALTGKGCVIPSL